MGEVFISDLKLQISPPPRYRLGILSKFEMSQLRMNFNQFHPSQELARLREYQLRLLLLYCLLSLQVWRNKYFSQGATQDCGRKKKLHSHGL